MDESTNTSYPNQPADENDYEGGGPTGPPPGPQSRQQSAPRPEPPFSPPVSPEPPRPVSPSLDAGDSPCLFIGPIDSGKTALLLAISRACFMPGEDNLELEFVPEGETATLMGNIRRIIVGDSGYEQATREARDYPFWIYATEPGRMLRWWPSMSSLRMVVSDGPGGSLFPREDERFTDQVTRWQPRLVEAGMRASSIVFCVDSTKPLAELLQINLPELISRMCTVGVFRQPQPWYSRLARRVSRQPIDAAQTQRKFCLRADRFLLLLTKVDHLCADMAQPAKFARMINPVGQARDLLGVAFLNMIKSALKPNASFAVGISSAWGFDPDTDEPLAGPRGMAGRLATESIEDVLKRWTPFGIREIINYIATGREGSTVRLVRPEDLRSSWRTRPLEFSYRS